MLIDALKEQRNNGSVPVATGWMGPLSGVLHTARTNSPISLEAGERMRRLFGFSSEPKPILPATTLEPFKYTRRVSGLRQVFRQD